jgi:hypothetical protein
MPSSRRKGLGISNDKSGISFGYWVMNERSDGRMHAHMIIYIKI